MIGFIREALRTEMGIRPHEELDGVGRAAMAVAAVVYAAIWLAGLLTAGLLVFAVAWLLLQVSGWILFMVLLVLGTAAWIGMWA